MVEIPTKNMATTSPHQSSRSGSTTASTPSESTKEMSKEKCYENFLITTNTEYRKQNIQLQSDLTELQREKDDLEIDNGKIEDSQRYMRGILKNYFEIDSYNEKLKCNVEALLQSTHTSAFVLKVGTISAILAAITIGISRDWMSLVALLILISMAHICIYDVYVAIPGKKLRASMRELETEIDTIKKTNALLPDLFDHL